MNMIGIFKGARRIRTAGFTIGAPWLATLLAVLTAGRLIAANTFVKDLSSNGNVVVTATAVHPVDGSVFVVGTFDSVPLAIGTTTLALAGGKKTGFIAKLGSDGAWRWAGTLDDTAGRGSLSPRTLFVGVNNIYIGGDATNGLALAVQNLTSNYTAAVYRPKNLSRAPFVVNLDLNGKPVWLQMATNNEAYSGGSDAFGYALAVDGNNDVYVCGSFRSDIVDVTGVSQGLGLNFGTNHAFRARDTSGTGANTTVTEWINTTRDGYLAKLNGADGSWKWVATGGGQEDEATSSPGYGPFAGGFYGVAVDSANNVYVTGNGFATYNKYFAGGLFNAYGTANRWSMDGTVAASGWKGLLLPNDNTAFVIKMTGSGPSEGQWKTVNSDNCYYCINTPVAPQGTAWYGVPTSARGITIVNDQIYVTYQKAGVDSTPLPAKRAVQISKLLLDLSTATDTARITVGGSAGTNDIVVGSALTADASGNLYLSGRLGYPGATFALASGTTNIPVSTANPLAFAAKLSSTLAFQWVQTCAVPPPVFGEVVGAVEPQSGRYYFASSFSNGVVDLGPTDSDTQLPSSGAQGANARSFVSAIDSSGNFLQQVNFQLVTDYGASEALPPQTPQTVFKGSTIAASVPPVLYEDAQGNSLDPNNSPLIASSAVVRHTCTGYQMVGTALSGNSASYSFVITADTQVKFLWETDYALDIKSDPNGSAIGLSSPAAGNPNPTVQKHWVPAGTISTAFIEGLIATPNAGEYGVRYRSLGYTAQGATAGFNNGLAFTNVSPQITSYATVPNENLVGTSFTIEFWARDTENSIYTYLFSYGVSSSEIAMYIQDATRMVVLFPGGNSATVNRVLDGQWHHHAMVYQKNSTEGTGYYYRDGQLLATLPRIPAVVSPGTFNIANYCQPQWYFGFNGGMDDIRIWNTNRTPADIQANFNHTLAGNETGLQNYWKCDETTGSTLVDSGGAGQNATLVGATADALTTTWSQFIPWASVQTLQQVPQFLMNGPATITYSWAKEVQVQVNVTTAALTSYPTTIGGGVTTNGTGLFWFTNNASVRLLAPARPTTGQQSYQIKGFVGGLGNVTTVTGTGNSSNDMVYYDIPALTQASSITWDYSDRIFQGVAVLGNALDFSPGGTFTGTEAISSSENLDALKSPLATSIVSNAPPGSTINDMCVWDDVGKKLYPLRPGTVLLEWARQNSTNSRNIYLQVTVNWPSNVNYVHIANTPPVPLDPSNTNSVAFVGLKYSESDKVTVSETGAFSAPGATGTPRSVLLFSQRPDGSAANGNLALETLFVRTVQTKSFNSGILSATATIGSPIKSAFHSNSVPFNGYVYYPNARYNAALYNHNTLQGPIIPVNFDPTATNSTINDQNLVVVWYRTQDGIHWPYQAVRYAPQWPVTANRIVVASRLGSEGLDTANNPQLSFDPNRYQQVSVYNQPDPNQPGYNPNEEHAFIATSLLNAAAVTPPPTAYALRNNLNVTNQNSTYTSDPYVLVQYYDTLLTNWNMAVYQVQTFDPNIPRQRLVFPASAATGNFLSLGPGGVLEFNYPLWVQNTALRTNEVVNLELNNNVAGAFSGQGFLIRSNDNKFLFSTTLGGAPITATAIAPAENPQVVVTRAYPYVFDYEMKAGELVVAPYPLQQIIGATPCPGTIGQNIDPNQAVYWQDHNGQSWAVSGSTNPAAGLRMQFYYPLQPGFWTPKNQVGDCFPYVQSSTPVWVTNHVTWPLNVPALKAGESLTFSGGEINSDNPHAPGLPGVIGWAAGRVVYDDANPNLDNTRTLNNYLARLAAPLTTLQVALPLNQVPTSLLPAAGKVTINGTRWTFNDLDASLQPRVFYDQSAQKLSVRGLLNNKTLGDSTLTAATGPINLLQPDILTARDSNALVNLVASAPAVWVNAVSNLVRLSRDPLNASASVGGTPIYGVGLAPSTTNGWLKPATQFGPGLALLPNADLLGTNSTLPAGYVTLAENDDPSLGAAPVALHIIKIQKQPLFRGAILPLNPPNAFDEKVSMRFSGDFGANADNVVFQWWYKPDDGGTVPPPDLAPNGTWLPFPDASGRNGLGMSEVSLAGAGAATLTDNLFFVRWRHGTATNWSDWAGAANSRPPGTNELAQNTYQPQLAAGWIKRVLDAVNPFEARINSFRADSTPANYVSMVQQAGVPYNGPVALNADKNVVENVGLIQLYTTVLKRAKDLSIDASTPVNNDAVNNSILLAASHIADLYLLLGNEAYTDAQDPTIGYGTTSTEYGALAPTIFCFQNQVPSLMDEELALLRGVNSEGAFPTYNRLLWNFTKGEGEAAYALSYNITDQNSDGFINAADAQIMYPQGHGDAWGHYLSALRTYYDLLRHPVYKWQTRAESLTIGGVVVKVDYLDERKFAQAAAAKAKVGAEVVNLTYRNSYVEDPDGQWQGYQDTDTNRAWGVTEWSRRAACGALFDWVTANAILPANDTTNTGISKVDRTTVKELPEIASQAREIRRQLDNANAGLNPLGLSSDVVSMDVDPSFLEVGSAIQGETPFEQVYDRSLKAMQNALDVFNNANNLNNMLRQVASTAQEFSKDALQEDLDFRNRLIEVFGTPYAGCIGAGKTYPAGYAGPDLYLYMYTDVTGIADVPPPSSSFSAFFGPMQNGLTKADLKTSSGSDSVGGNTIADSWSFYFPGDALNPTLESYANTDFSQVLSIDMPQTASAFAFQAPAGWGARRAPGSLQQMLSELVQAEADFQLALHDYDALMGDITKKLSLIRAHTALQASNVTYQQEGIDSAVSVQRSIYGLRAIAAGANLGTDLIERVHDGILEGIPKVVGLAVDANAPIRGALEVTAISAYVGAKTAAVTAEQAAYGLEGKNAITELKTSLKVDKANFKYETQEQLQELESFLGDESAARIEVFRKQEALREVSDKFRSELEAGQRILDERELYNKQAAALTQQNRYQDFTFRVARNDALSKYRAAFDLAARYVYLAAKSYDYECNLDPNDPASSLPILSQIIHAQTLGELDNGVPRLGSGGLADALAKLKSNFDVLKTQMGFNNPQNETGQFSLRNELFRIEPGPTINGVPDTSTNLVSYAGQTMTAADAWASSDAKWRDAIQNTTGGGFTSKVYPDLWSVPEFRRYCRPFAPQSGGAQPGLVITFNSQIVYGKNFFGWPLGGGDSSYDPTHFATKIRSVGVWLDNYNGEGLSVTPRAYLIPAGVDIMLVPKSTALATREYNVVDQRIPVPLPVSKANLQDPNWIPIHDSLNGTIADIRQYSMFRVYHDAGFTTDQMTTDSRLVGRSVWNTRWMLIIPGGTLLADPTEGLNTLLRGSVVPGSKPSVRDGNGVKDIKLFFQTYAYSGN